MVIKMSDKDSALVMYALITAMIIVAVIYQLTSNIHG